MMKAGLRCTFIWFICVVALILPCSEILGKENQFVIVSDLHPSPNCVDQLTRLTDEIVALRPAFIIQLGDVGNEEFPGSSVWQMQVIDAAFRRMREAGIEIHVAVGNHDVPKGKPGVAAIKRCWFCSQLSPYPFNSMLDASKNPEVYKRFCINQGHYYSFDWQGLHLVIADSNDEDFKAQGEWLKEDLCGEASRTAFASLIFVHHPEWMSGDRNCTSRPLYQVLAQCSDRHNVKAVFGGHYHFGVHWPAKDNLGADVYATPASVVEGSYTEYVIATVEGQSVTFEQRKISNGANGQDKNPVIYQPIHGNVSFGTCEGVVR